MSPKILLVVLQIVVPAALGWGGATELRRRVYATDVRMEKAEENTFGPIRLRLRLPGTHAGIPEPLIACGKVGDASLVFIRLLPNARARVGIEFWNLALTEGEEFPLPAADGEIDVVCYLPALFPAERDGAWQTIPEALRRNRRHSYAIMVDGRVRHQGAIEYPQTPHPPVYLGANPLGGSFVSSRFTGKILRSGQHF